MHCPSSVGPECEQGNRRDFDFDNRWDVDYIRKATGFPGREAIRRGDREIKKSRVGTSLEALYFVTGLEADQASFKRLMGAVRDHCVSSGQGLSQYHGQ